MAKVTKKFSFDYPLNQKVVRDLRLVTEYVCDLSINGTANLHPGVPTLSMEEARYDADIEYVLYNGQNILPVLECMNMLDDIQEAANQHARGIFEKYQGVAA